MTDIRVIIVIMMIIIVIIMIVIITQALQGDYIFDNIRVEINVPVYGIYNDLLHYKITLITTNKIHDG